MPSDAKPARAGDAPRNVGVIVIHGNGDAEAGWINELVVARLEEHAPEDRPDRWLVGADASEVYALPDSGSPNPDARFNAFVRRAKLGIRAEVAFTELYWADLSRIGDGPIYQFFAAMRLFYEAPSVLGRSILDSCKRWYHKLIRQVIMAAIWTVRWFISGMNGAVFTCAFALIGFNFMLDPLSRTDLGHWLNLPRTLGGVALSNVLIALLLGIGLTSVVFARHSLKRGAGLVDICVSTAVFAFLGLAGVAAIRVGALGALPEFPIQYLAPVVGVLINVWIFWSALIVVATALILMLGLKRLVLRRPQGTPAIDRFAGALGLAVAQGQLWKVFMPLLGVLVINSLYPEYRSADLPLIAAPIRDLEADRMRLLGVFTFNCAISFAVFITAMGLIGSGSVLHRIVGGDMARAERMVPRVIINRPLVWILVGGTLISMYFYYTYFFLVGDENETIYYQIANSNWLRAGLLFAVIALFLLSFTGIMQSFFDGVLHFSRDVVDHQYRSRHKVLEKVLRQPGENFAEWPRREQINRRLDTLMNKLVAGEKFERLVFLTHSQGSVIMHDYFRSGRTRAILDAIPEVHVVTLGSPITHLYQNYFEEYAAVGLASDWLPTRLVSWTNMWRLDDPIGKRVHIGEQGLVHNVTLPPGGHGDYWREKDVCQVILELLTRPKVVRASGRRVSVV